MAANGYETAVAELMGKGVPRAKAEAAVRDAGLAPLTQQPVPAEALERAIEAAGDRLMRALGFSVVRFSHPGRTKQTPGIADRRYYRAPRVVVRNGAGAVDALYGFAVWWEVKSPSGRQRPDQVEFQAMVAACGEEYVLGGLGELRSWLVAHGVVTGFAEDGTPELVRETTREEG